LGDEDRHSLTGAVVVDLVRPVDFAAGDQGVDGIEAALVEVHVPAFAGDVVDDLWEMGADADQHARAAESFELLSKLRHAVGDEVAVRVLAEDLDADWLGIDAQDLLNFFVEGGTSVVNAEGEVA